jgi:hypothetical protein
VTVIRQQIKDGADFIKIYETGRDRSTDGKFLTIDQYSELELARAVAEAARMQTRIAVHCTGEPGALYAAQAGVASIDHAYQLSDETMRLMRERQIYAVPTFTISEYFAAHAAPGRHAERRKIARLAKSNRRAKTRLRRRHHRRPRRPASGHRRPAKSYLRNERRRHLSQVAFYVAAFFLNALAKRSSGIRTLT